MQNWNLHMKDLKDKMRWKYRAPLPLKKQRVQAKPEPNGKVKIYSEEQKLLYALKHFPNKLISTV